MKNEICGIYLITERATGRGYVGLTTRVFTERWGEHRERFPPQLFDYEVLLPLPFGSSERELKKLERFYIDELDTMSPNGFNRTRGGNGSGPRSPEMRKKASEAVKAGYANRSEEKKKQNSEAKKSYHASLSAEEKKKRSEAIKARWAAISEEKKLQKSEKCSAARKAQEARLTEEEKRERCEAVRCYHASLTDEEKRERSKKISDAVKAAAARKRTENQS